MEFVFGLILGAGLGCLLPFAWFAIDAHRGKRLRRRAGESGWFV